jgi:predicted porin
MKKTQMALAAVALVASTAAMAEVTVYGIVDAGVANSSVVGTQFSGDGGWVAGNNLGIKGSEDLGGGLKASFNLRAGFNLAGGGSDNGGNGKGFNQLANVGLSGDFGSIALGQQFSPFIGAIAGGTAGNGHFFVNRIIMGSGAAGALDSLSGQSTGGFFIANAASYTSPEIAGFTVTGLTNAKSGGPNSSANTAIAEDRYDTVVVNGNLAGAKLALGYETRSQYKNYVLAATYPIGDLTVSGTVMNFKPTGETAVSSYSVSASYPLMASLTGNVQYASRKGNGGAFMEEDATLTSVGLNYSLSKSTSTYLSYTSGTGGIATNYSYRGTTDLGEGKNSTTALGIVHSF